MGNKSKTTSLKARKCSVKTENRTELCGNSVCTDSSLQLNPHYTSRQSTHCYKNGFQASSLTVNSLKKSSRGTALFLSAGLQKELNKWVCFGPSLKIVCSSKQVKKGWLFLDGKRICAFSKMDIFCSVILSWPALTLWNKPLLNITLNNMCSLTMNYSSLPCIYIFILAWSAPLSHSIAVSVPAERG